MSLALAAGCILQVATTELELTDAGWLESTRYEVAAVGGPCPHVDVRVPRGVELRSLGARMRRGDGTSRRVGDRFEAGPATLSGDRELRLHLPDLLPGDRVLLDVARHWPVEAWHWEPAPALHAELRTPRGVPVEARGEVRPLGKRGVWAARPGPADVAVVGRTLPAALADDVDLAAYEPAGAVEVLRTLRLEVPPGDPQLLLFPGGGSSVRTDLSLRFPPHEHRRAHVVPLPDARSGFRWTAEPDRVVRAIERPDGALVLLEPSEGPIRVALSWTAPDAPTYGERAEDERLTVDAPGGRIAWEGDAWLLVAMHDRPVLPARSALITALDRRFRERALSGPGLPVELRGLDPGWDTAALLRDALHARAVPATHPTDPLWPRRLLAARRSGAVSSTEAALITWLYAEQLGLHADWALVRPAWRGPGAPTSPAGHDRALVRLTLDGEVRWMDPTCAVCAPFELPPEHEGASALGPGIDRTPDPTPGRWHVDVRPDAVAWTLEGPPALLLRRWLAEIPEAERATALAERMAGPGAELLRVEGAADAGAPIVAEARRGRGIFADPLALPVPNPRDGAWVPWVGERSVRWVGRGGEAADHQVGPLTWRREARDGDLVETLHVAERLLSAEDVRAYEAARGR